MVFVNINHTCVMVTIPQEVYESISIHITGDKTIIAIATDDKSNRFNDAHCDRQGRVWSGTITIVEGIPGTFCREEGMLFSFDGGMSCV